MIMIAKRTGFLVLIFFQVCISPLLALADQSAVPQGFVDLADVIPGICTEIRYYSADNFVGKRIDGYLQPRCILTAPAAAALAKVQDDLRPFHFGLKIFDCYRPQRAVDQFVNWAQDLTDTKMKAKFYPDMEKDDLLAKGYIAAKSSHSRGSTVDLTLISIGPKAEVAELDMGTGYDLFGPLSWPDAAAISPDRRAHRLLLQTLMKKYGFSPYTEEWWHFTLTNEPFPDTYFNFPVQ